MEQDKDPFCREKDLPLLQMPAVQPESPGSKGKRKDLHYLPEMQNGICKEKLIKEIFCVWLY